MKYVLLSDIHFGHKSNSDEFNKQCLDFLDFVATETEDMDIDGCIFLGDYYHNRNTVNVKTLQAGTEGLFKLGDIGRGNTYLILGNHDLYLRDSRSVHPIIIPEGDIGVKIIQEPIMIDKMLLCPWLVEDETLPSLIKKFNPEYVLGHFEIASFPLNAVSTFDGIFNPEDYNGPKRIISGHFHKRSEKNNITYMGNCFSHDFSDVNDWHNKGYAIFDTDTNTIEYFEWKNAPKYCTMKITQLQSIELGENLHLKLINDANLKPFELNEFVEGLKTIPQIVDCMVYPQEMLDENDLEKTSIENIDNIDVLVVDLLKSLDMENIDSNHLVTIYRDLDTTI
jgi:hypothetical protein